MPTRPRVSPRAGVLFSGLSVERHGGAISVIAPRRPGSGSLRPSGARRSAEPIRLRIGEELEEGRANEPIAERALRRRLDRLPGRLDQPVVLHAGGTRSHAGHAPEAEIEVPDDGRVERDRAVQVRLHQLDPAAWRVHLLAPEKVGRARRQAEAAVDAVARERAEHVRRRGHASTPRGRNARAPAPAAAGPAPVSRPARRQGGTRRLWTAGRRPPRRRRGTPAARRERTTIARGQRPDVHATRPTRHRRPSVPPTSARVAST